MALWSLLALTFLVYTAKSVTPPQVAWSPPSRDDFGPNLDSARANSPYIFNAIHSSMRQWGSSLQHNGLSFWSAAIPAGVQLYHGTHTPSPVMGMEWLAFEIEHAEIFARTRRPGGRPPGRGPGEGPGRGDRPGGRLGGPRPTGNPRLPLDEEDQHDMEHDSFGTDAAVDGYLHIYRTTRPLSRVLYIDGMSAGKTSMGTLDSTDYILRNQSKLTEPWGDYVRAQELCDLGALWEIEGFIRMEAGFELILCNFTKGLELVSAVQRPAFNKTEAYNEFGQFEYVRGVAMRYQGITGGRVAVDFSTMVSAFFYQLNLTNPDPSKPELPRLTSSDPLQLERIKTDLKHVLSKKGSHHASTNWQDVVDMIVTRYSDRLKFMTANATNQKAMLSEINFLLNVFTDYSVNGLTGADVHESTQKCSNHYLQQVVLHTEQDHLIHAAISTISQEICKTLYEVRATLLRGESDGEEVVGEAKLPIRKLIDFLNWTTFKECGKCAYDEVCFVAIWPWGSVEDHKNPGCIKSEVLSDRRGYWG